MSPKVFGRRDIDEKAVLGLCFFWSQRAGRHHDRMVPRSCGSRFQYDRFRNACLDEKNVSGFNPNFVGECADLAGVNLAGQDLSNKNLRGANLKGANLQNTNLSQTDLRAANLLYSNWENTLFKNAKINASTYLPFDGARATKLGLTSLENAALDKLLEAAVTKWLRLGAVTTLDPEIPKFIELGADYLQARGFLVHEAIKRNRFEFLDYLLQKRGFNFNGTYENFVSYYLSAIRSRNLKDAELGVNYLIVNHADPNMVDRDGETALWAAADAGMVSVAELLLNAGAQFNITFRQNTLLAYLTRAKEFGIFELLVNRGANLNVCVVDKKSCSLLELALQGKKKAHVDLLLTKGLDASRSHSKPSILDYVTDLGTLIRCIALGANPKNATLHDRTDLPIIDYLVQNGANINSRDTSGMTLLTNSLKSGRDDLVDFALSAGADPRLRTTGGMDAFGFIFINENMTAKYLQRFLNQGADANSMVYPPKAWKQDNRTFRALEVALRQRAYFLPLARAGAKINDTVADPKDSQRITASAAYIMGFANPLTPEADQELQELSALGADLNTYKAYVEQDYASFTFLADPLQSKFQLSRQGRIAKPLSLPGAVFLESKFVLLARLQQLGANVSGPQNGMGQPLSHMATSVAQLQFLVDHQIPLTGLDANDRTALYYLQGPLWDFAFAKGVAVSGKDKFGDTIFLYMVHNICDPALETRLKAVLQQGVNLNLVSDPWKFSFAHVLAAAVKDEAATKCAIELFKNLKPLGLDLNTIWNYKVNQGYGLLGLGLSNFNSSRSNSNVVEDIEGDEAISVRQSYFNLFKAWVDLGYDPVREAAAVHPDDRPLLELAYDRKMPELVAYLKSLGLPEAVMKSRPTTDAADTNACNFFTENANYKLLSPGCTSAKTGIVWSAAEPVGQKASLENHSRYCANMGRNWRIPEFKDLLREQFTQSAPSQYAVYTNGKSSARTLRAFNPATGDVKTLVEGDAAYYICRYDFVR